MRKVGYWSGVTFLIAGAAIAMAELLSIVQGARSVLSLGVIWYQIHPNSLVGFQAAIENRLSPALWPPFQFLLTVPSWALLVPLGVLLVILCWPRARW